MTFTRRCSLILLAALLGAAFSFPSFARGGVLSGSEGKLSVIQTEYFDIIYPAESEDSARRIEAVCDGYYEKLCASFLIEPYQRFPVTITPSVESLNAYFTLQPYNRIVLYDALPETNLDMNAQTLENVFYHELTHAVTGNLRYDGLQVAADLIGDFLSPAFLAMTQFWIEGVAVEAESRGESGRLNDPFSTLLVSQAKVEEHFPTWRDVTGARDIFPGGTDAYMFGALFSRYLCETYGEEAYGAYWKRVGYGKKKVPADELFKALTEKRMKETWKDFTAWLGVPENITTTFDGSEGAADFFTSEALDRVNKKTGFSRTNSRTGVFRALDTNVHGLVWAERKSGGIWYCPFDAETQRYGKSVKLFTVSSPSRISLSDDGRYIAVSYLYDKHTVKTAVCVYDLQQEKLVTVPHDSIRDAAFVRGSGGELLLCALDLSPHIARAGSPLRINRYAADKKGFPLVDSIAFEKDEIPYSPVDAGNGGIACIVKHALDWKIRVYSPDGKSYTEYGADKTVVHELRSALQSDGRRAFSFSYAAMGPCGSMFPRAGLLYAESGNAAASLTLQDDDISGGVLEAALSPRALASGTDELCYIAGFYDTHRLLTLDLSMRKTSHKEGLASETKASAMAAPALEAVPQTSFAAQPEEKLTPTDKPDSSESAHAHASAAQDYNPFRYMKNGIFLPLMTSVVTYDEKLKPSVNVDYFLGIPTSLSYIGASFLTSNPWGDHTLLVSAGSDWEDGGGANLSFSGGNQSFSYSFSATVVGNKSAGFLQTSEVLSLSKTLYARYGRSLSLGATGTGMYGYGVSFDDDSDLVHTEDKDFLGNATGFVRFSTVHKCAPGYFQYAGIFVQPFAFTERTDGRCTNAGASVGARIPGLFPLTLTASLFPTSEYCAEGSVSAVLFSHEIQHAIPGFYFDRVYLSLGYSGKLAYESDEYFDVRRSQDIFRNATMDDWTDRASLTAGMFTSINIGAASYVEFQLTASLLYYPHPEADKNRLGATFGAVLVY